jgi:hypothetical protein
MSYPPKPDKAPKDWKPDWTVNALFLSQWMGMPGMPDMGEMMRMKGAAPESAVPDDEDDETPARSKAGKNRGIGIPLPPIKF